MPGGLTTGRESIKLSELATDVATDSLAIISDDHKSKSPFEVAHSIIEMTPGGGKLKLLLEIPDDVCKDGTMDFTSLKKWATKCKFPQLSEIAEYAHKEGWLVAPIDCTKSDGGSFDFSIETPGGAYGAERQKFMADRAREECNTAKAGCLLVVGRNHVKGNLPAVESLSKLLTGGDQPYLTLYKMDGEKVVLEQSGKDFLTQVFKKSEIT